ncbi:hypothetical protein [Lentzea kentuckyensis]|uniref:hypothetical protein n=1 Tax=Lentzea kentuckyensis TaxID=360086 RepID=UPI000A3B4F83|nr:hypothetical protein [Lentzea kentuckyensis]
MPEISRRDILRGGVLVATVAFTSKVFGDGPMAAAAPADGFAVACNALDITPTAPPWPSLWMAGYGWGPRGNHGVIEESRPLTAHCIAIHDNGSVNVLLRIDAISIPRDVHQEIRRRVVEDLGVGSSDFMMAASHSHSTPFIGDTHPDPYVLMGLTQADIDAVNGTTFLFMDLLTELVERTVNETPIPAELGYSETVADIGYNRRGLSYVIDDVPVLTVRASSDDTLLAVLFGATAHPVCRGNDEVFDADYCGAAAELIEERLGAMAFFFLGTAGDHNAYEPYNPDQPAFLGARLADAVVDEVWNGEFTPVTGPITTELTEIELEFSVDNDDPEVVEMLRDKYEARRQGPGTPGWLGWAEKRHADVMIRKIDDGTLESNVPMPIQCWKLGGLTILGLAHEVVGIYHLLIKDIAERLGTGNLWIMAYANETQCYVPSDEISWTQVYESGWNQDDNTITGYGSSQLAYGWPSPFRASPPGTDPAAPDSTEAMVLAACEGLLG